MPSLPGGAVPCVTNGTDDVRACELVVSGVAARRCSFAPTLPLPLLRDLDDFDVAIALISARSAKQLVGSDAASL